MDWIAANWRPPLKVPFDQAEAYLFVMAGLDPATGEWPPRLQGWDVGWMPGTSPGITMTDDRA
jgi:hypothetical protein